MKKILLVGELNQTVANLNQYLSSKFDMQVCTDSLELVKGMVKVSTPELVVICLVGVGRLDNKILDLFKNRAEKMPVLLIGTEEECKHYKAYYEDDQFDYLVRPIVQSQIIQKCSEMLDLVEENERKEEETEVSVNTEKKKILVIDDSAVLLRSVKSILDKDYDVFVATSGEKGIQTAKKKQPDLIILDYQMPEMDGKQTLEEIRKNEEIKDIPVMFLTGVADKEHITMVLGLNPVGYQLKPIAQDKLLAEIEKVFKA